MGDKKALSAVILAAGYSSRMGKLKPLLKFGEQTALEVLAGMYSRCEVSDIIVVTGHDSDRIVKEHSRLEVKWVFNPDFDKGMYSSVVAGVKSIECKSEAFFLNPVDIPLIRDETVSALEMEFSRSGKGIIYPVFNGEKGHPVLISGEYRDVIAAGDGEGGLERLLSVYKEDSAFVQVCDMASVTDMDNPRDYSTLLSRFKSRSCPNESECMAILEMNAASKDIIEHCGAVSAKAANIAEKLVEKGYNIDIDKVRSAAMLHDMARGKKDHAARAADMLRKLGYEEIAGIVASHMDIQTADEAKVTEAEIVYLADKLACGDKYVTLEEKFAGKMEKYRDNTEALDSIEKRYRDAVKIRDKIVGITGEGE